MSELPAPTDLPEWDLADRLRKALRHAGMKPGEMADYLNVGSNTVSTWLSGRIEPSAQTIRLWALRTGIPAEWFCAGSEPCVLGPLRAGTAAGRGYGPREINMHLYPSRKLSKMDLEEVA